MGPQTSLWGDSSPAGTGGHPGGSPSGYTYLGGQLPDSTLHGASSSKDSLTGSVFRGAIQEAFWGRHSGGGHSKGEAFSEEGPWG